MSGGRVTGAQRRATYYPRMPPALPGESAEAYTDRLTGADLTGRVPYNHRRNRQCSIGYHRECSDPVGEFCECPCHRRRGRRAGRRAACGASEDGPVTAPVRWETVNFDDKLPSVTLSNRRGECAELKFSSLAELRGLVNVLTGAMRRIERERKRHRHRSGLSGVGGASAGAILLRKAESREKK